MSVCAFMSERRPKIAILVHSLNAGGAQQRAVAIASGLAAADQHVEFIAVTAGGDVATRLPRNVKQVVFFGQGRRPWYRPRLLHGLSELRSHLIQSRPDTLLAASTNVHLIAALAAKAIVPSPRLVLRASRHPIRSIPRSKRLKRVTEVGRRWVDRWSYNQADAVVAVSDEVGAGIRKLLSTPQHCIVLRNPVVTDSFLESLCVKPDHAWLNGKEPVILAVGRLVWQKGFDCLIAAFAEVRKQRPARLIILGEGKHRERLAAQAEALGIADHVDMPGHVNQVGSWMAQATILVSSSNFEGSPAVLIEALAAGCPVVATSCPGGSVELLRDQQAGILVDTGDAAALASAMIEALDRPWDQRKIRQAAEPYRASQAIEQYTKILVPGRSELR